MYPGTESYKGGAPGRLRNVCIDVHVRKYRHMFSNDLTVIDDELFGCAGAIVDQVNGAIGRP